MTGEPIERFGKDFKSRLERNLPEGVKLKDLHVCPSGLVVQVSKGVITPIGCPQCIGGTIEQDAAGYPLVNGKALIPADEIGYSGEQHGHEIVSNLWFCPRCKVPVSQLLPKFNAEASDIG